MRHPVAAVYFFVLDTFIEGWVSILWDVRGSPQCKWGEKHSVLTVGVSFRLCSSFSVTKFSALIHTLQYSNIDLRLQNLWVIRYILPALTRLPWKPVWLDQADKPCEQRVGHVRSPKWHLWKKNCENKSGKKFALCFDQFYRFIFIKKKLHLSKNNNNFCELWKQIR